MFFCKVRKALFCNEVSVVNLQREVTRVQMVLLVWAVFSRVTLQSLLICSFLQVPRGQKLLNSETCDITELQSSFCSERLGKSSRSKHPGMVKFDLKYLILP